MVPSPQSVVWVVSAAIQIGLIAPLGWVDTLGLWEWPECVLQGGGSCARMSSQSARPLTRPTPALKCFGTLGRYLNAGQRKLRAVTASTLCSTHVQLLYDEHRAQHLSVASFLRRRRKGLKHDIGTAGQLHFYFPHLIIKFQLEKSTERKEVDWWLCQAFL